MIERKMKMTDFEQRGVGDRGMTAPFSPYSLPGDSCQVLDMLVVGSSLDVSDVDCPSNATPGKSLALTYSRS